MKTVNNNLEFVTILFDLIFMIFLVHVQCDAVGVRAGWRRVCIRDESRSIQKRFVLLFYNE